MGGRALSGGRAGRGPEPWIAAAAPKAEGREAVGASTFPRLKEKINWLLGTRGWPCDVAWVAPCLGEGLGLRGSFGSLWGQQVPRLLLGASATEPLCPWKSCFFLHREPHSSLSLVPQPLPLKGGSAIPRPVPRQGPPHECGDPGTGEALEAVGRVSKGALTAARVSPWLESSLARQANSRGAAQDSLMPESALHLPLSLWSFSLAASCISCPDSLWSPLLSQPL